jgi:hypothetical protein
MNPRELVDHIRSGPEKLVLNKPLRFRRRTRSNPCDFNEFLQALQSSVTIRTVQCGTPLELGLTEDEWVLLLKTTGRIRDIQNLTLGCSAGSRHFRPFQAVADAVENAQSLCRLEIRLEGETFPGDPSGLIALANALQEHTTLQEFMWGDVCSRLEATQNILLDPVLRALPTCPHLQIIFFMTEFASADAIRNLLQLQSAKYVHLVLETEQWLAVADEIRRGRCNIKHLYLHTLQKTSVKDTEAVKAIASAIRLDHNLERLVVHIENDFTDEAGVVLAEALAVNKTLHEITLSVESYPGDQVRYTDALNASTYEALSAMLRVNTRLRLEVPPFNDVADDKRLVDSRNQMRIERGLNRVDRGRLLSSSQTTRDEWVDALDELNSSNAEESPEFNVSCLYSLLRLNPATCM